ncbi:hypothetical protein EYS42_07175 [Aquabacterium lacunae]|uniref:Uncharacterized protein n=1 Tax=Aquabacterium lacunae TaxID=2528630 RepID=A0A4V2JG10_9BURK|nr:hypothetical protein [Aquabacterium lacunae]TBO32936.1 hypothetical protein EYS42_07175 [Aquabacterium lacunae]
MNTLRRQIFGLPVAVFIGATSGCRAMDVGAGGPGMMLVYGSVIDGKRVSIKKANLPDGRSFPQPGGIGGSFKGGQTWLNGGIDATMATSGDHRELPEWVDFEWSEPPYPEDPNMSLEAYRALPRQKQRLEIKRRIPPAVVEEAIASKRVAQPGKVADKTLWIYIFWTPDGMKMRWAMRDRATGGPFGEIVREGGDDLDRYNLK